MGTIEQHRTYCRFCVALCGIVVDVDGDRVLRVRGDADHPISRGYTCPKGRALGTWHHHPDRLDVPLVRQPDGTLAPHSWDDALDDLGVRLRAVIDEHGPDAVAVHLATGSAFDANGRRIGERLVSTLGTRSKYTSTSIDTPCKPLVSLLMTGHPGLVPAIDHERTTLTVLIGTNPVVSHGHFNAFPDPVVRLRALAEAPRELWVIDPRRTESARLATRHLAPRPGTDHLLLAHAVRELLVDGADHAYLERRADAEDVVRLRAAVNPWTAARTAATTGLDELDLADFVAALRRHRRVAAQTGTGTTMAPSANATEWLTWVLHVVTGSYDQPGGMWFHPGFLRQLDRRPMQVAPTVTPGPGPASRPELLDWVGERPCAVLADEIEAGNVKALIVIGGNPMTSFPEPDRLARALSSLDVLAVADVVHTATTALATHVLPCAGQLERADLPHYVDQWPPEVVSQYTPAVVPPAAQRRPMWWVLAKIGERLGREVLPGGLSPDSCTDDGLLAQLADRSRSSFARLREARVEVDPAGPSFGWVEQHVLPGGRWRLAPEPLVEQFERLAAEPVAPLVLVPRRQLRHLNSQLAEGGADLARRDDPELLVHPADAAEAGLGHGDLARVEVDGVGALTATVRIDTDVRRGVVSLPHGFSSVNVGRLTSGTVAVDPLTGMVRQSAVPVTLSKA